MAVKSGAGLGTRSVPRCLRHRSWGRGVFVLGPARTANRQRVGPARSWRDRQVPVPGSARDPLPPSCSRCGIFAGHRSRSGGRWTFVGPHGQRPIFGGRAARYGRQLFSR